MPSKYYNPTLARNLGNAAGEADLFGGSEEIEKSFKQYSESLDKMQERRDKQNEIKRKKLEDANKGIFNVLQEHSNSDGIPQVHKPFFQAAILDKQTAVSKCMTETQDDPLSRHNCVQSFKEQVGTYKSGYSVMSATLVDNAKRLGENGGFSKITKQEDIDIYNTLKDHNNWKPKIVNGVLYADLSGNEELMKTLGVKEGDLVDVNATLGKLKLYDKGGEKVHENISGELPDMIADHFKNNYTVAQGNVQLENTLGAINASNVGEVALQLGIGGANGEYSEGLARIIDENSVDEMIDFDDEFIATTSPEEIQRLMLPQNEKELQRLAKQKGWATLRGPEALIERVKDNYRFQYFDSRNKLQAQKDEENRLAGLAEANKNRNKGSNKLDLDDFKDLNKRDGEYLSNFFNVEAGAGGGQIARYDKKNNDIIIEYAGGDRDKETIVYDLDKQNAPPGGFQQSDKDDSGKSFEVRSKADLIKFLSTAYLGSSEKSEKISYELNKFLADMGNTNSDNNETENVKSILANWEKRRNKKDK